MRTEGARHVNVAFAQNSFILDPTLRPHLCARRASQNSDSSDRIHHRHNLPPDCGRFRALDRRAANVHFTGPSEMYASARPALKHALHLQKEPDWTKRSEVKASLAAATTSSVHWALRHSRSCSEKLRLRASPARLHPPPLPGRYVMRWVVGWGGIQRARKDSLLQRSCRYPAERY